MSKEVYTKEMDEYILGLGHYPTANELLEFKLKFNLSSTDKTILNHYRIFHGLRSDRHIFSKDEDNFIIKLRDSGLSWEEVKDRFNERYNTELSFNSVKSRGLSICESREYHDYYTEEQDKWLRNNITRFSNYDNLSVEFNKLFNTNKSGRGVQSHCVRYLNIISGRQAFKKGFETWNRKDIGHEYLNTSNGYTYVKINDTGIKNKDFISKQVYLYKQYHGEDSIKRGNIIVFLNGDKSDFSTENLYQIPRKINAVMNNYKWFTDNRENTLTAIRWCELYFTMKDVKEG